MKRRYDISLDDLAELGCSCESRSAAEVIRHASAHLRPLHVRNVGGGWL